MDVEVSGEPKFCDHDDEEEEDDLPLSAILPLQISCLRKCSDETVKKRPPPCNSFHNSVKKSKGEDNVVEDEEDDDILISRFKKKRKLADKSFSMIKMRKFVEEHLALVEESIEECHRKGKVKKQRLQSLKRDINKCSKELANKKIQVRCVRETNQIYQKLLVKIEECSMELVVKEAQLCLLENLIGEQKLEFKTKEVELHQIKMKENEFRRVMENLDKDCERKEEELRAVSFKIAECSKELRTKEIELDAMKELIGAQAKKLESMRKQFEGQVREHESKVKHLEKQRRELESREKKLEGGIDEFKSKKKVFEGLVKEFESKEREFQGQKEELETEKMCFESRVKVLELEKMCFESRAKEFESKEKQLDDQMKEFDSKKGEFEGKLKEYESKEEELTDQKENLILEKMCFESRVKEFESKEKQLDVRMKDFESKKREFEDKVKEYESKDEEFENQKKELKSEKMHFESQVKELESQKKNFESRVKELESKEREFEKQVRELKSDEQQLQGRVMELKPKNKHFESRAENFKTKEKKLEGQEKPLINSVKEEEESGNQLSPSIEENSLQLVLVRSEKTDDNESFTNHILDNLLASSDPSKVVLEIIQNPIVPQCRKEHNIVTIDGDHIALLVQLMRISTHIKPNVREEAMKLALDLKAHMSENSQAVLGFLLILSIYGLSPSFDKDEVFKLFGFVAQHKIAVELFETLGFADKVFDFVQNLIREEQHIAAVIFICAYDLIDKYQPFNLLREHMQKAKLISESSCKKTNSIEIKDKARDEEITCLKTVLDCISDNHLQSESLLNEIQFRIFELIRQKGK